VVLRATAALVSPPPGWTLISAKTMGTSVLSLLYERTAPTAGVASYSWTFNAVTEAAGGIVSYGGASKAYDASITDLKVWNGTDWATCGDVPPESADTQLVSLRVAATSRAAAQTIDVVKRCHNRPTPYEACQDSS
jgi:hypothetical protein